jgi:hypothetical protein
MSLLPHENILGSSGNSGSNAVSPETQRRRVFVTASDRISVLTLWSPFFAKRVVVEVTKVQMVGWNTPRLLYHGRLFRSGSAVRVATVVLCRHGGPHCGQDFCLSLSRRLERKKGKSS